MFSLSVFLVMQTLEAMIFRLLVLVAPALLAWWYAGVAAAPAASDQRRLAAVGGPR
jgi:hypothetical protein